MPIDEVILEVLGKDPRVAQLAEIFGSEAYGKAISFKDASGEAQWYAAIRLAAIPAEEDQAVAAAAHWVQANTKLLDSFHCEKVLEIQSHLTRDDGSRSLYFDSVSINCFAAAGIQLRHQFSREV